MKANIDLIKQKVSEAELVEALELLENSVENTEYGDAVILLQGRYNRLVKSNKLGVVVGNEFDAEMNKISLSILDMLRMLKSDFVSKEMRFEPNLYFFESAFDVYPPYNERVYAQNFDNTKTRSIGWELRSQFPFLQFPLSIGAIWRVFKTDNIYSADYNGDFTIPTSWSSFWLQRTYGFREPGLWQKGIYTVEVYIFDNLVGKGSFSIV